MKSFIKFISIITFSLAYLLFIVIMMFPSAIDKFPLMKDNKYIILFIIGIINVVALISYLSSLKLKSWVFTAILLTGTVWLFPPLNFTYIGIPFQITYLIVGLIIFINPKMLMKKIII
ncbi:hypothetical protein KMW28_17165 [Flammeovirga yaeyamensis]|uniref:Uncharacterized protein n=1 Tax=Flammeovirga yaeyamensis TaxID=367791 RepID=A0AAX1N1E9_9BACT|nr:hypothetical protein [Flammeovirga yaeyamensis]MBB3698251.1 ABC-type transport system involved in multi-copper enzyme maturation permease subunit [Flammeovirga yaeyamensis]NMF34394.1 hypothetical protein [Flammeovirga yaeyamensis]QWG01375.1 hypothetical protein KMW28_17165 [Flammeovirga yaeyamensis]